MNIFSIYIREQTSNYYAMTLHALELHQYYNQCKSLTFFLGYNIKPK